MDREQEQMQFLGFFGIFKESFKIITSWRKIFSQITIALILPLTFVFLGHIEISNLLFRNIVHTENEKDVTRHDTKRYSNLSDTLSSERTTFFLFKVGYFTIYYILSLLSTAAIVYTIASVYTGREVTFKKVMSVVPRVWKRLMVTFVCMFAAFLIYIFFYVIVGGFVMYVFDFEFSFIYYLIFGSIIMIIFVMGFVYMALIWQLASVVTVLESSYGFGAMIKSMNLIKGNWVVPMSISLILNVSFMYVHYLFESMVVYGSSIELWKRLAYGVLFSLMLLTLNLYGLVIQTMIYLVCKSYHHEKINKEDLSNYLGNYLGEYTPLIEEVQLEQSHV